MSPAAKATPRRKAASKPDDEALVRAKIESWPEPFRAMGMRLHVLVMQASPELTPKLWYGMPGYSRGGPVLCFFRHDLYMTFGLSEKASFRRARETDQLMESSWFFTTLDDGTEARLVDIVRNATT
jgi:hypothetical protein